MSQPLISVILTYYNHARYIAQAVESVLNQTHANLELFVINDGSPDTPDFEQAIEPFLADPRLQVITQANRGVAASRNEGLARSKGQYLCLLDSDDWLHPEKLARQVAVLDANPELGMVYCDIQLVSESGKQLETVAMPQRTLGPLGPNVFEALWVVGFFEPSTPLLRREWYKKSGPFTVGIEGHSDYEFWLRLSALGCPVKYLPERLVFYRTHQENFSKKTAIMEASRLKARRIIIEKFPEVVAAQDDRVRLIIDGFQAQIRQLQGEVWSLQAQIASLQDAVQQKEQQLAQADDTLHSKEQQLAAIQTENRQMNEILVRYRQDLRALQQTRTVRLSAWVSKLAKKIRKMR